MPGVGGEIEKVQRPKDTLQLTLDPSALFADAKSTTASSANELEC